MSGRIELDRQITAWLVSERPVAAPEGLLEAVAAGVKVTPRRAGWRIADRWTWRHEATLRRTAAMAILVSVLAALIVVAALVFLLAGSSRPAPPFGLTRPGFIAFDSAEGIVLQTADGTSRRVIVGPDGASVSPTFSRDGLHLAYWHRPGASGPWSLVVVDPDGSGASTVAEGVNLAESEESLNQPSNIAWSPDSRRIAYAADVGSEQALFVVTLGERGAKRITGPSVRAIFPTWRPDGSVIAFQDSASETLHVVAPDGSGEHQLSLLPHTSLWPEWSPDGSMIATTAARNDDSEIFTVSADGKTVRNRSGDQGGNFDPTWSPDGSRLAWAHAFGPNNQHAHIVIAQVNGPNVTEIRVTADFAPPIWSPDGSRIFSYLADTQGAFYEVLVIDPTGVAPVVHLNAAGNIGNSNWQRLPD